jgi:glycosyltransferase involved in cell wall biosynthesis
MNDESDRRAARSGRPRILGVIRWPVGGIRSWCRYVYGDRAFEDFDLNLFLPDSPEASTLRDDLFDSGVKVFLADGATSTGVYSRAVMRKIFSGRYDLVHSHGFTSAVASSLACRIMRTRHLVTPHDMILDHQYRNLRGRFSRFLIGQALRSADRVQAVSAASGDNLRHAFPRAFKDDRKLLVVRNGIDTSHFLAVEPEEARDRFNIPADAILVGFFGRFMGPKGFRYLVDAVRLHQEHRGRDLPLVVLAVGSGGFEREEKLLVRSLGLDDAFRFIGFSPDIADLLKAVDVVAMPSLWEACGLVAMEALTAGVPIVVSDCRACLEVADGSPARVVPMRDSSSLLKAILEMSSPAEKAVARSYMETAAARFDVAGTRQGITQLYASLTHTHSMRN